MSSTDSAKRWGLHTARALRVRARELGASEYLIKDFLPVRSTALLVGDSGLGKSPLVYQIGICIASGLRFLGKETTKGSVVLADFENGIEDMCEMSERISRYLDLPEPPDGFSLWTPGMCDQRYGQPGHTLLDMVRDVSPRLVIVDSLGSFAPDAELKNPDATRMLQEFRALRKVGTATLLVHHRRKQPRKAEESAGPLEHAILRQWFQDARGASALINGSDVRLGVDETDLSPVGKAEDALVLRGFGRVRGEIGPFYLTRDADESGDPMGYRRLLGPELLGNESQKDALASLPPQFTFKEAKAAYRRTDQPTKNFLDHCIDLGLVEKVRRGHYEKVAPKNGESDGVSGEDA
jgi:hypothetical protein